jgi:hypothetical protein
LTPPTAQDHRDWAAENERFYYDELGGCHSSWPQWAMPALFYAALHELQAFFVDCGLRPATHKQRSDVLRHPLNRATLGPLLLQRYRRLESLSRAARYECVVHNDAQFTRAEQALEDVRNEIRRLGPVHLVPPPGVPLA